LHPVEQIELRRYRLPLKQLPEHSAIAVARFDQLRSADVSFQDAHNWRWLPVVKETSVLNTRFLESTRQHQKAACIEITHHKRAENHLSN
jgi:hypothetical protein